MRTLLATIALGLCAVMGCGGGGGRARVHPGTMPEGGSFHGVWQSPQWGEMHFCQEGTSIHGRYQRDERSGRVQGHVEGDLMRFSFEEIRELVPGRPNITRGHGYFRLVLDQHDQHQTLQGEWGLDENETGGGPWTGDKLRRREPECVEGED